MICKAHRIGIILFVLVLLAGCARGNSLEMTYSLDYYSSATPREEFADYQIDNVTPYQELITKTIDIHAFAQRYNPYGGRNIADVKNNFGIECLRKTDKGAFYSVHKVKQGGLLYVFYGIHLCDEGCVIRWFYVRDTLSYADFETLTKGTDTIEDVIKINQAEQIFLNIYYADPLFNNEGVLYTTHYLKDGILDVAYTLVDGKLVFTDLHLTENFDCPNLGESTYIPYDGHILNMDWVE